jgi:hypothetical protein
MAETDRGAGTSGTEEALDKDEFDVGFSEATGEPGTAADQLAAIEKEEPEEVVVPKVVAEKATPGAAAVEVETIEKVNQRYLTLQGIHRHDKETYEQEAKRLREEAAAEKKEKERLATELDEARKAKPKEEVNPEEDEQMRDYEKEFDVVAQMEGKRREKALKALEAKILASLDEKAADFIKQLTEVKTTVESRVAPVEAAIATQDEQTHFDTIREAHPDFEKFRKAEEGGDGSLPKWIESKPSYVQDRLKEVYEHGTPQHVVEMLSDFKRENNITTQPDNVVSINKRRTAKRQALLSVPDRPAAVSQGKAPAEDFDSAFDEAVKGG